MLNFQLFCKKKLKIFFLIQKINNLNESSNTGAYSFHAILDLYLLQTDHYIHHKLPLVFLFFLSDYLVYKIEYHSKHSIQRIFFMPFHKWCLHFFFDFHCVWDLMILTLNFPKLLLSFGFVILISNEFV